MTQSTPVLENHPGHVPQEYADELKKFLQPLPAPAHPTEGFQHIKTRPVETNRAPGPYRRLKERVKYYGKKLKDLGRLHWDLLMEAIGT